MNTQIHEIDRNKRLFSMVIDYIIFSVISAIIILPAAAFGGAEGATADHSVFTGVKHLSPLLYLLTGLGTAFMLCKDSFEGRSPGKRIMGFQVIDDSTGQYASPMKCFLRNITYPLNFVELIVAAIKPTKRLGDMIAKTHVAELNPNRRGEDVTLMTTWQPFVAAFALGALYIFALTSFTNDSSENNLKPVAFVESSENRQAADALAQAFTEKYGSILNAEVKVYDELEGSPDMPYISVLLDLNENYTSSYPAFETLKNDTYSLLLTQYPLGTFAGQIKYLEPNNGKDKVRILRLDWR